MVEVAKIAADVGLAGALVISWSSGFVGSVLGTRIAPVDSVLMWRSLITTLLLGGWVLARKERVTLRGLSRQIVIGLLLQVVYLGCVFTAAQVQVPAGTTSLVDALQPLLMAVAASVLLGERTAGRQVFGLLLGAAGAAVVVAGNILGGQASAWAYLLPVGALIGLGAGTVLDRRWRSPEAVLTALAIHSATASVAFSVFAVWRGDEKLPVTGGSLLAITWLVLSSAGGYGFYLLVVSRSRSYH